MSSSLNPEGGRLISVSIYVSENKAFPVFLSFPCRLSVPTTGAMVLDEDVSQVAAPPHESKPSEASQPHTHTRARIPCRASRASSARAAERRVALTRPQEAHAPPGLFPKTPPPLDSRAHARSEKSSSLRRFASFFFFLTGSPIFYFFFHSYRFFIYLYD